MRQSRIGNMFSPNTYIQRDASRPNPPLPPVTMTVLPLNDAVGGGGL